MTGAGIFGGPTALGWLAGGALGDVSSITLEQGVRYRARLKIKHSCIFVTERAVVDGFTNPEDGRPGFSQVQAWLEAGNLPPDWPADRREFSAGDGCPAWVEGTWNHPGVSAPNQGSQDADLVDYWAKTEASPVTPPDPPGTFGVDDPGGSVSVPSSCWDLPGFKAQSDECFRLGQVACQDGRGGYDMVCVRREADRCQQVNVNGCEASLAVSSASGSGGVSRFAALVVVAGVLGAGAAVWWHMFARQEALANRRCRLNDKRT